MKEDQLCLFYLYEEVKGLGGLNLDRKLRITEDLQDSLDERVEVGPIIRPAELPRSAEPYSMTIILISPPDC